MKKLFTLIAILLVICNSFVNGQSFKEHHIITSGSLPYGTSSIDVADFNNDGKQDVIACSSLGRYIYLLENKGNEEFETLKRIDIDLYELHEVGSADIDNDGLRDIVFSRFDYRDQLAWLKNMGDNRFEFGKYIFGVYGLGWETMSFSLQDMNGDNYVDAVVGHYDSDGNLKIILNNGDGAFYSVIPLIEEGQVNAYECVDIDKDNDVDVIFNTLQPYQFVADLNNGNAEFSEKIVLDTNHLDRILNFKAFDSDGDDDIDIMGIRESRSIILFRNDGNHQFTQIPVPNDSALAFYSMRDIDIDKDGDLDLIDDYFDLILENAGNNEFIMKKHDNVSLFYKGNKDRDLNNNGIEDIVYSYKYGSIKYIADASLDNLTDARLLTSQLLRPLFPAYQKINNDEFSDICVVDGYKYVFYINNGLGEFPRTDTVTLDKLHFDIYNSFFYDINRDGFGDVISYYDYDQFSNKDSCKFKFAKNNQNNTFTKINQNEFNNLFNHRSYFNDLNNDSSLEVILTNDLHTGETDTILIFNIDQNFTAHIHDSIVLSDSVIISNMKFYDIDNNGQKDILICDKKYGINNQSLLIAYSNNNLYPNHFDTIISSDLYISDFTSAHITDDTISDILLMNESSIHVLENFDGNSFEKSYHINLNNYATIIFAKDINNDGIDEVIFVSNDTINLLRFDKNHNYSIEPYYYNNTAGYFYKDAFIFPDIDLDGDLDLLCTYALESDLSWFENSLIDTIDYASFPEDNAVWTEQNTNYVGDSSQTWTSLYVTESDTTILNNQYTNIYEYYLNPETFDTIRKLYASIRQDKLEKKVYIIRHYLSENKEKLLLDFKVNTGDTVVLNAYYWNLDPEHTDSIFIVDSITTTTLYNFEERNSLYLSNHKEQDPVKLTLIEGVGSIQNPFGPITNVVTKKQTNNMESCCPDYLICQTVKNEPVYVLNDEARCGSLEVWSSIETQSENQLFKIYPNPARDRLTITFNKRPSSNFQVSIYDIHGKLVNKRNGNKNEPELTIDLNNNKSGLYLLKIKYENSLYSSRFIVL